MTLSKADQRTLDEIERALRDDDPQFVSNVSFDHLRRHRLIVGVSTFLLGVAMLIVGEVTAQQQLTIGAIVSLVGFVVMVAAIAWPGRRAHRS